MSISPYNKILHIGINYVGTRDELSGCINDVDTMSTLTKDYALPNRRLILTDNTKYKPTISNICLAIRWLRCKKCTNTELTTCSHGFNHIPGTSLYFTYSGHGSRIADSNSDEKDKLDETIYVLDGNISDDYIFSNLIYPIPKDVKLWIIMDCCYSSTSTDLQFTLKNVNRDEFTLVKNNEKFCSGNIVMVSGCLDEQTSADAFINGKAQGALTSSIKYILTNNPNIRIYEMMAKLKEYMIANHFAQRPTVSFGSIIDLAAIYLKP